MSCIVCLILKIFDIILIFLPIFFGIYVFIYIIKECKKGAEDLPLRIIVIQLSIATSIPNGFTIILSILSIKNNQLLNDEILFIFIKSLLELLFLSVPSLLSSYIWSLKNVLSPNNYFQLYPFATNFFLILINWVIPYVFIICIYIIYRFYKCKILLEISELIISLGIIGVSIFGFIECILIKKTYGYVPCYDNNKQITLYMVVLGGFIISLIIYLITIILPLQITIVNINLIIFNVIYIILPIIFFLSFCYTWTKKKTTLIIEDEQFGNPFDSIIQENETY